MRYVQDLIDELVKKRESITALCVLFWDDNMSRFGVAGYTQEKLVMELEFAKYQILKELSSRAIAGTYKDASITEQ